jgi:trk system potassium uptake protein TrkA
MFILIVGVGRVGSSVARTMLEDGHTVSCLDEGPESHARLEIGLDKSWEDLGGRYTVGAGLEIEALEEAGIAEADAFVAATDGDNTNLVIAQVATQKYQVGHVAARIQDPARAEAYADRGFHIISPVKMAIEGLASWALAAGRAA